MNAREALGGLTASFAAAEFKADEGARPQRDLVRAREERDCLILRQRAIEAEAARAVDAAARDTWILGLMKEQG